MARVIWKALRAPKSAMGMVLAMLLGAPVVCSAGTAGLIISEFMPDPTEMDFAREYVELRATRDINFVTDPYSVVFCNNGTASTSGWVAGGGITYGFNIISGTVAAGDVIYVGGSDMAPGGTMNRLRTIDVASYDGDDGLGVANASGLGALGNGGDHSDGIAVFDRRISSLDKSVSPIDAIFFGTAIGKAHKSATDGYELPVNDFYNGGKILPTSFFVDTSATSIVGKAIVLDGLYNTITGEWERARSYRIEDGTDGISAIQLILPTPPVNPPPPTAVPLPGAAWGGIVLMGVVGGWRARPWRKR